MPKEAVEVKRLSSRSRVANADLLQLEKNLKKSETLTKATAVYYYERAQEIWDEVKDIKTQAVEHEEFYEGEHSALFHENLKVHQRIREFLYTKHPPTERTSTESTGSFRSLPKLELPTFSGNFKDWRKFKELFTQLIINQNHIPNIEKFVYLTSCLEGDPLQIITALEVSGEAFTDAWKLLSERYDDKSKIIDSHIHALLSLPTLQHATAASLRELQIAASSHWLAIQAVPTAIQKAELIVEWSVLQKLDPASRQAFLISKGTKDLVPLQNLLDFISLRAKALDSSPSLVSNVPTTSVTVNKAKRLPPPPVPRKQIFQVTATRQDSVPDLCPACRVETHHLHSCFTFRRLHVQDRINLVSSERLCFNCLRPKNTSHLCSPRRCRVCAKLHHTLLHRYAIKVCYKYSVFCKQPP